MIKSVNFLRKKISFKMIKMLTHLNIKKLTD
jgi:hypothetical protein